MHGLCGRGRARRLAQGRAAGGDRSQPAARIAAAGADRGGGTCSCRHAARRPRLAVVLHPAGVRRRGPDVCGRDGVLRHGAFADAGAVEPQHVRASRRLNFVLSFDRQQGGTAAILSTTPILLGAGSGSLVGFSLGLVGGGGSILAVPLLVYVVGVSSPHVAIGTSAVAVAANASLGLLGHARTGSVKWACAGVFAIAGVAGAYAGSTFGKMFDGQRLLALFAILMMAVAVLMLTRRGREGDEGVHLSSKNAVALVLFGLATGALSGFFGIGGGFLIVPALILATGMPILSAVGSSLLAVTAFGATTAANYAFSGLVDWPLAAVFIAGGAIGSFLGSRLAKRLAGKRGALNVLFAAVIFAVAIYMLVRTLAA